MTQITMADAAWLALRLAGHGIGLALLLGAGASWAQASGSLRAKGAQEIAPFRLTGIEGYMQSRYLRDDNRSRGQPGIPESRATQSLMSDEVFLMTHSYIYHPTLLSLDVGGGPLIERGSTASDDIVNSTGRQLYNLTGRATILRDKPYNSALFYDHKNQTQNLAPAQIMATENNRYGFEFSLLKPVIPTPLRLEVERSETSGKSVDQVTNDRFDRIRFRMDGQIGKLGRSAFVYQGTRQESESGSSGLPIQSTTLRNDQISLGTHLTLGEKQQYELTNLITRNVNRYALSHGAAIDLSDLRFSLDLRGRHSADLRTYARYNWNSSEQGDQSVALNSLRAGLTYRATPELSGALGAHGDVNRTSQLASNLYGIDGSATYQRTLPLGQLTAGYNFAYTQRDQQATAQDAKVIGEQRTLTGTTSVPLARPRVVAGSVVVNNLTRTQTFVEGSDYVLSVIGLDTRIQRVIGGNILDGQDVLVDYAFDAGGTYAVNQLDQALNLNWGLKNYVNVYLRLADSSPQLRSGTPTVPLNPAKSRLYGARADLPLDVPRNLLQDLRIGGRAEWEDRREAISPYARATQEVFAQVALPLVPSGSVRLGKRHTQTDYELGPDQGVNLNAYDLRLWARVGYGVDVFVDATRERDTGTPVLRERSVLTAKAQWSVRRLRVSFDLTRTRDAQGATERTRSYGMLVMRRDFR